MKYIINFAITDHVKTGLPLRKGTIVKKNGFLYWDMMIDGGIQGIYSPKVLQFLELALNGGGLIPLVESDNLTVRAHE